MRSLPRQIASAILLSLQLVLATRGFVWYPLAAPAATRVAAGPSAGSRAERCGGVSSAHDHHTGSPTRLAQTDQSSSAPMHHGGQVAHAVVDAAPCSDEEPPCHDGVGCHAGAPCCAPGLLLATYVTPSASLAAFAAVGVSREPATLRVATRVAHRLPLATAPPAV